MIESIEWLRIFILDHRSFEYIIIFFGAALGGEFSLFALGFLAGQDVLSTLSVIILGFAGTLFPNILWFFLGKTKAMSKLVLFRYADATTSMVTQAVDRMSKGNHFAALTIIKFIVGTPFILTMYVSKTDISFRRFILYESGVVLLSLLAVVPIGFVSGLGFIYIASIFNNLYAMVGFVLLVVVIIIMLKRWIKNKFTKSNSL
jgi:membrane protein DedA with SNARE-associated domain